MYNGKDEVWSSYHNSRAMDCSCTSQQLDATEKNEWTERLDLRHSTYLAKVIPCQPSMLINHGPLFVIIVKARCSSDQLNKIMFGLELQYNESISDLQSWDAVKLYIDPFPLTGHGYLWNPLRRELLIQFWCDLVEHLILETILGRCTVVRKQLDKFINFSHGP